MAYPYSSYILPYPFVDNLLNKKEEPPKPAFNPTIETVVTPIVGWRKWRAELWNDQIQSLYDSVVWPIKEPLKAECKSATKNPLGLWGTNASAACAGLQCSCGIYANRTEEQLLDEVPNGKVCAHDPAGALNGNCPQCKTAKLFILVGEVNLWGRIIEHERGFRAQYAYPKSFKNTGIIAKRIAEVYGVPLIG